MAITGRPRPWFKAALLCGLVAAAWHGWRWLDQATGNSEEVFARLRVGMSQHELGQVLQTLAAPDDRYSEGVTTDGRSFYRLHYGHPALDDLPPPETIQSCTVTVADDHGREIQVTLGRGGRVVGTRLSPDVWEYRWEKVCWELHNRPPILQDRWRTVCRAFRDDPYRALTYKYRKYTIGLTVGLLLTTARMWRRRAAKPSPPE